MTKIIIGREFPDVVIPEIENAKASIDILIYDWRWYENEPGTRIQKFNSAIISAVRRGVAVRCLVNHNALTNILQSQKIEAKQVNSSKTMHAKMIIIDETILILGSHNFTKNAFEINHEISVKIDDKEEIARCKTFFENLCLL